MCYLEESRFSSSTLKPVAIKNVTMSLGRENS